MTQCIVHADSERQLLPDKCILKSSGDIGCQISHEHLILCIDHTIRIQIVEDEVSGFLTHGDPPGRCQVVLDFCIPCGSLCIGGKHTDHFIGIVGERSLPFCKPTNPLKRFGSGIPYLISALAVLFPSVGRQGQDLLIVVGKCETGTPHEILPFYRSGPDLYFNPLVLQHTVIESNGRERSF